MGEAAEGAPAPGSWTLEGAGTEDLGTQGGERVEKG